MLLCTLLTLDKNTSYQITGINSDYNNQIKKC